MRKSVRLATVAVLALAGVVVVPAAAGAAPPITGPVKAPKMKDYLPEHPTMLASGSQECSKPINSRVGSWVCLDAALTSAASRRHAADHANAGSAGSKVAPAYAGYCTIDSSACWNVYSSVDSDFTVAGSYGYGDTFIGVISVYYETILNGAQARSQPVNFVSDAYVPSLEIEGDRLYYSAAYPEGNAVNNGASYAFTTVTALPAGTTAQWLPNGYASFENTVAIGGVVHEFVWTAADYPGNWYVFGKTAQFFRQDSGAYFYNPDELDLGALPLGSGYHP